MYIPIIVLNSGVPIDYVNATGIYLISITLFYNISISWLNYYTLYYKYKINV